MSSQVSCWVFWVTSIVVILNMELNIVEGGAYEETKVYICHYFSNYAITEAENLLGKRMINLHYLYIYRST